jgi:cell division transport system permease protein
MMSRLRYTFREMWASLSRNLTLTVAAIITSTVSLVLFGMTLLIQQAFDNQLTLWTGGVKMIVYVQNPSTPEAIATIEKALQSRPEIIKRYDYCDVPCSLAQAGKLFAADPGSLSFLNEKNIPSYFSVEPVEKNSIQQLQGMTVSIRGLPKVKDVVFPSDQIAVLGKLKAFFGLRTYIMSAVLLFASILLIWNTIRTAMFARRREIEVMKLVGATNWFIRLPFMLEGLLQGLVGASLASGFLLFLNADWTNGVRKFPPKAGLGAFVVTDGYPYQVVIFMMLLGALVGAIGSATAASRFLDV